MRRQLEETGAIFQTTMDSEVIAFHIARERLAAPTAEEAIKRTAAKTRGAYALIISSPRKLIGVRDPFGLRRQKGKYLDHGIGKLCHHLGRRRIYP